MKMNEVNILLVVITILLSCNSNKTENNQSLNSAETSQVETDKDIHDVLSDDLKLSNAVSTTDEIIYDDRRENLKLSTSDTIKKYSSFLFSNSQVKDSFVLTIAPGMVKNSKAELKIITASQKVIYKQSFDTFYFMREIFEPDTIPSSGGQEVYEKYMDEYWQSITPKQYEEYFKKSIDGFFETISFIDKSSFEELKNFADGIAEQDFSNEFLADSTIRLIDMKCFDCDEGAAIIGFSKKQNKVVTLLDHD